MRRECVCAQVGETLRLRAQRFPGIISGCTVDWLQPWPREALVSVAGHSLAKFEIICSEQAKKCLELCMGDVHDSVAALCKDYFMR